MARLSLKTKTTTNDLVVNNGTSVNDKTGDPLRTAFGKLKDSIDRAEANFIELYAAVGADVQIPSQTNNSGKFLTTNGTTLSWSTISQELGQGNWQFTGDTATVTGTTAQIGKNSSETITQEEVGGTISQTTTNTSQVAIDASSIVITRSVTQVVDDGVLVATDEAGSVASIGNGSAYLKTYSEPAGPNNTQYAEVGTSGTYAYLESRQDDVGGYTLGGVVTGPGTVSITAHSTDDKIWLFDQEGILTVPESSGITGINDFNISSQSGDNSSGLFLNGNPLVGSAILYANNTAVIRSDNNGNIKDWNFDRSGTITTPLMLPTTFTAVLDDAHMVDPIGFASEDPWWQFGVSFQVGPSGEVQTYMDNPFPILTNPGYVSGFTFRFTEADHRIPGFTFEITLNDVVLPGGAGWTANVAVTQPPEYPSTINTSGAIKLTSNDNSWVLGTTGILTLPAGGDIVDSNGSSVLGGASYDQSLNTTDSVTFTSLALGVSQQQGTQYVSVGGTPNPNTAVIFTAPMWVTSIKLVISVEGYEDGDMAYTKHTQTCEATISAIYNSSVEPVMSVYGLTHTTVTPLATFDVQRGVGNSIEVVATNTQTNNPLHVKVHAINFVSYFD